MNKCNYCGKEYVYKGCLRYHISKCLKKNEYDEKEFTEKKTNKISEMYNELLKEHKNLNYENAIENLCMTLAKTQYELEQAIMKQKEIYEENLCEVYPTDVDESYSTDET